VDEAEWLSAVLPHAMVRQLRGRLSGRKRRLILCAAARRLWHFLPDSNGLALLEAAERYADGEIGREELLGIGEAASSWAFCESGFDQLAYLRSALCRPVGARYEAAYDDTTGAVLGFTLNFSAVLAARQRRRTASPGEGQGEPWDEEARAQADLLREIVGNPFRTPFALPAAVLRWNDGLVPRLARSIYEDHRWHDLPLLADALLDAGCEDDALMGHCREGAGHARGCWALDIVLGRL
jgi:hypothetical protein